MGNLLILLCDRVVDCRGEQTKRECGSQCRGLSLYLDRISGFGWAKGMLRGQSWIKGSEHLTFTGIFIVFLLKSIEEPPRWRPRTLPSSLSRSQIKEHFLQSFSCLFIIKPSTLKYKFYLNLYWQLPFPLLSTINRKNKKFSMAPDPLKFLKPPVCEALVDIRVQHLPLEVLPKIESLHSNFSSRFPTKKIRYEVSSSFKLEEKQITTEFKAPKTLGYIFESSDKKKLVQFRRDGFTFNQLKPDPYESWPGWDSIKSEAKEFWNLYSEAISLGSVERIALRYINKIVIKGSPGTGINLDDYLTAAPQIPQSLPQTLSNYFTRVEFEFPEVNGWGIISIAPNPDTLPNSIIITLDIEVYQKDSIPPENDRIWSSLNQFRNAKNNIFKASLTDKALELFK